MIATNEKSKEDRSKNNLKNDINNNQNSNQKKKLKKLKDTLVELGLVSTSHGIPSILRTEKRFLKLMWLLFFLLSTAYGIYFSTMAVINFLKYEVVVQIKQVKEIPTEFPTITFSFTDSKDNFTLDQRLISCYFNSKSCNYTEFEDLRHPATGIRYFKFNGDKNFFGNKTSTKKTKLSGAEYGLSIQLYIGSPDDFTTESNGLSIYIHNNSFDPVSTSDIPITLSPGAETNLKVERTFSSRLEAPYSDCKSGLSYPDDYNSFIFKQMVSNSIYKYTQKDCFDLCQTKYIYDKCNISMNLVYTWVLFFNKNGSSYIDCAYDKREEFFDLDVDEYCGLYCPLECETIKYDIQLTFTQFPTKYYTEQLASNDKIKALYPENYNVTQEDLKQTLLSVSIFYDDLGFTQITEDPKMLPVDLVSNMGGILGLFIGISFLSLGEIFEVFFEIIFILFDKYTKRIQDLGCSTHDEYKI